MNIYSPQRRLIAEAHAGDGVPAVVAGCGAADGRRGDAGDGAGQVVDGVFAVGRRTNLIVFILGDRTDVHGLHLVLAHIEDDVEGIVLAVDVERAIVPCIPVDGLCGGDGGTWPATEQRGGFAVIGPGVEVNRSP